MKKEFMYRLLARDYEHNGLNLELEYGNNHWQAWGDLHIQMLHNHSKPPIYSASL